MFEKIYLYFFQVPAGAMEKSSEEDDDSNVQDEIKITVTNKSFMTFFGKNSVLSPNRLRV